MKNVAKEEEKLAKAIEKKIAKMKLMEGEAKKAATTISKKTCICAPTNHTGSFRCQLHRMTEAHSSSSLSVEETTEKIYNNLIINHNKSVHTISNGKQQNRLSRFARAASSAKVSNDKLPITKSLSKSEQVNSRFCLLSEM